MKFKWEGAAASTERSAKRKGYHSPPTDGEDGNSVSGPEPSKMQSTRAAQRPTKRRGIYSPLPPPADSEGDNSMFGHKLSIVQNTTLPLDSADDNSILGQEPSLLRRKDHRTSREGNHASASNTVISAARPMYRLADFEISEDSPTPPNQTEKFKSLVPRGAPGVVEDLQSKVSDLQNRVQRMESMLPKQSNANPPGSNAAEESKKGKRKSEPDATPPSATKPDVVYAVIYIEDGMYREREHNVVYTTLSLRAANRKAKKLWDKDYAQFREACDCYDVAPPQPDKNDDQVYYAGKKADGTRHYRVRDGEGTLTEVEVQALTLEG